MAATSRFAFLLVIFIGLGVMPALAQNRYVVLFKDKTGTPFTKTDSLSFLSQKAVTRRVAQHIALETRDLPVNPAYVQAISDLSIPTFYTTRWMNGVLVQCAAAKIAAIQSLPFVDQVVYAAPGKRLSETGRKRNTGRKKQTQAGETTAAQNRTIGIDYMHQQGYHGEGVTIAVLDGGFPGVNTTVPFHDLIADGRIDLDASYDFVFNTHQVFQYDRHGTEVLSTMTAYVPDTFVGGAYKARYQLYVTEDVDSEFRIEEYNWLFAAEHADSAGVDIISTSLGYYDFDDESMNYTQADMNGATTVVTRAAQWASERGIVVVSAAGNEGTLPWKIISAPADAPGVLAVGNVGASGLRATTSSTGPTADGRIKPDVSVLGQSISVVIESGTISAESGTSVAAPQVAALVAGVWQHYPQLTAREVVTLIKSTASQASAPDNQIGYGIPNFKAIVNYQETTTQEQPFIVYPNPFVDTLHIRPNDINEIPTCQLELISALGTTIATHDVTFDQINRIYETDLATLSPGLYILNITTSSRRYTFRIIKR